jgi:hypothetical protein
MGDFPHGGLFIFFLSEVSPVASAEAEIIVTATEDRTFLAKLLRIRAEHLSFCHHRCLCALVDT